MKDIDKIKQLLKSNDDKNIILGLELLYNTFKWSIEEIVQFCMIDGNIRFDELDPYKLPVEHNTRFQYFTKIDGYLFRLSKYNNKYHHKIFHWDKRINYKMTTYFAYSDKPKDYKKDIEPNMKRIQIKFIKLLLNIDKD